MLRTLLFFLLLPVFLSAQQRLEVPITFSYSKPYCLFNFMETIAGRQPTSQTLYDIYAASALAEDRQVQALIRRWKALNIHIQYELGDYPPLRKDYRDMWELLSMLAARSESLDEFGNTVFGLIPNTQHQDLMAILRAVEPAYNQLIWTPCLEQMQEELTEIRTYAAEQKLSNYLENIRGFYASQWPSGKAFEVSMYPVPAKTGHLIALPRSEMLLCGLLLDNPDRDVFLGIALHEISHVLYEEQPLSFQRELHGWVVASDSPFAGLAYSYLNEALATAIGNGWIYEKLTGELDPVDWYSDRYIDGFARAIYPLVKNYLEKERTMDRAFITRAIELFMEKFPRALYEYEPLFNGFHLFTDLEESEQQGVIMAIAQNFRFSSYFITQPITAKSSLQEAASVRDTRIIVINHNIRETLARLADVLPELKQYPVAHPERPFVLSILDSNLTPLILIGTGGDPRMAAEVFTRLRREKQIQPDQPLIWLDE